jgi:plasmid stabilization system protein ParE
MKLGISPLAEQDMEAIGDYIAQDNPVRAVSFTEELYQQCLLIAESPVIYKERPELGQSVRSCTYGRWAMSRISISVSLRAIPRRLCLPRR